MGKTKIANYPFLVKAGLFYLFVKIVDGFFSTLGTVLFENMTPLLKTYSANVIIYSLWFHQWLTKAELKITPIAAIFLTMILYLIFRISSKFV